MRWPEGGAKFHISTPPRECKACVHIACGRVWSVLTDPAGALTDRCSFKTATQAYQHPPKPHAWQHLAEKKFPSTMTTAHATGSAVYHPGVPARNQSQPEHQHYTSTPATTQTHTPNTHIKHTHVTTTKSPTNPKRAKRQTSPQQNPSRQQTPTNPQTHNKNPQQTPTKANDPTKPTTTHQNTKISAHGFGPTEKRERKRGERKEKKTGREKGREAERKEKYQHTGSNRGLYFWLNPVHFGPRCTCTCTCTFIQQASN
jgi:hypothetical protein